MTVSEALTLLDAECGDRDSRKLLVAPTALIRYATGRALNTNGI